MIANGRTDPLWDVASATQVLVADPDDGDLAWRSRPTRGSRTPIVDGVLVATRHPTGWFVHAVRRDDLPEDPARAVP